MTTAFLGAGVIAFGAGNTLHDAKTGSLNGERIAAGDVIAARNAATERANRGERSMTTSITQNAPDAWVLPLHGYQITSVFGYRWGKLHSGVDLGMPEGTPFRAVHAGTVVLARWYGGYGYCVMIDHGNGLRTVYGHSSKLLVHEGDKVQAGDIIALVGDTGYSFGSHLHLEIQVNGVPQDPIPWFKKHGVDLELEIEDVYGASENG